MSRPFILLGDKTDPVAVLSFRLRNQRLRWQGRGEGGRQGHLSQARAWQCHDHRDWRCNCLDRWSAGCPSWRQDSVRCNADCQPVADNGLSEGRRQHVAFSIQGARR